MSDEWCEEAKKALSNTYNAPVRDYSTYEWGRQRNSNAVSVVVQSDIAYQNLENVRSLLVGMPKKLKAFVGTTRWYGKEEQNPENSVEVVIARCETQFDILRVAHTADVNGDQSTDDIIERLRKFDRDFGIDIYQAANDRLLFRLKSIPTNLKDVIQDIDEFCPDATSQVYGSSELMEKEVYASRIVYLWWD